MSNPERGISSSSGRGTRRRTRSTRHVAVPRRTPDANNASGSQQQPPPTAEQLPLTQSDIPKIVELIVKQLPVSSNANQVATQRPPASTSSQAPSTTLPATVTTSAPVSSSTPPITVTTGTSSITLPRVENALEGNSYIAGVSVHLPLTVPALGCLPPAPLLSHISTITPSAPAIGIPNVTVPTATSVATTSAIAASSQDTTQAVFIGQGLPPVPKKLASKIESGEFVDMSELLPDRLGCSRTLTPEDKSGGTKSKKRAVANILEWIKCFSVYIAIIAQKNPDRVPDLLGYQSLIIDASIQYDGDGWVGYDRWFRLNAAANSNKTWATLDATLWNRAFTGYAKVSRCKHCFSLTHTSSECEWAPEATDIVTPPPQPSTGFSATPAKQYRRICRKWNNTPGRCPIPGCTYEHICLNCAYDPTINNKSHKAIHCPSRKFSQSRGFHPYAF